MPVRTSVLFNTCPWMDALEFTDWKFDIPWKLLWSCTGSYLFNSDLGDWFSDIHIRNHLNLLAGFFHCWLPGETIRLTDASPPVHTRSSRVALVHLGGRDHSSCDRGFPFQPCRKLSRLPHLETGLTRRACPGRPYHCSRVVIRDFGMASAIVRSPNGIYCRLDCMQERTQNTTVLLKQTNVYIRLCLCSSAKWAP